MGNCVFKTGSRRLSEGEGTLIRAVIPNGGVMELHPPITAEFITNEFPGHAIYQTSRVSSHQSSPPLLHNEELRPGHLYYLLPLTTNFSAAAADNFPMTPYRLSAGHKGDKPAANATAAVGNNSRGGVWMVRLVISPEQLVEILAQDARAEALIETVRKVAKCGSYGAGSGANSTVNSDQWSEASSRKGCSGEFGHEDV